MVGQVITDIGLGWEGEQMAAERMDGDPISPRFSRRKGNKLATEASLVCPAARGILLGLPCQSSTE